MVGPRPNDDIVGLAVQRLCIILTMHIRITLMVLMTLPWAKALSPVFSHWHPDLREVTIVHAAPLLSQMGKPKLRERTYLSGVRSPASNVRAFPTA